MRVTDMEIVDIKVDYAKAGLEDPNYQPTLSCFVPKVYEETGSRDLSGRWLRLVLRARG